MRPTITFDDDVAAAIEQLRCSEGIGLSEAVNRLIRAGLAQSSEHRPDVHASVPLGLKLDVTNIGDVLDALDG